MNRKARAFAILLLLCGVSPIAAQSLSSAPPRIDRLSQWGLQTAATTRLAVIGKNLGQQPRLVIPGLELRQSRAASSTDERLVVDIELPGDVPQGIYPVRVLNEQGISNPLPLAVDRLNQLSLIKTSREKPATLPVAVSGNVSGAARPRVYFHGVAGEPLVIDLEASRLGASMKPVLELYNERGVPLKIAWQDSRLGGDARIETQLPQDGIYFAEVHDSRFKAAGRNPFRVKIGALQLVDSAFPPVLGEGASQTQLIGSTGNGPVVVFEGPLSAPPGLPFMHLPDRDNLVGPAPVARHSAGKLWMEPLPGEPVLSIPAKFATPAADPVSVCGRILKPGESDKFLLNVEAGQKLRIAVQARAFGSPLDGRLSVVHPETGIALASNDDQAGSADPAVQLTVPEELDRVRLVVSDLHGRGGPEFIYQLAITPATRPDFGLMLTTPQVNISRGGRALVQLNVQRRDYNGPIELHVEGCESLSIQPAQTRASGRIMATLVHDGNGPPAGMEAVQIVGRTPGQNSVRIVAARNPGNVAGLAGFRELLPVGLTAPLGLAINTGDMPRALVRGMTVELPIEIVAPEESAHQLRLSLVTTEAKRRANVFNPKAGNKPVVRSQDPKPIPAESGFAALKIIVPVDVAEKELDLIVKGEILDAQDNSNVQGTLYSQPFRLPVQQAVTVKFEPESLKLVSDTKTKLKGTVERAEEFSGALEIALNPLPIVYEAQKVTVAADQREFELEVMPKTFNEEITLPLSRLLVTSKKDGKPLVNRPLPLQLLPKAK